MILGALLAVTVILSAIAGSKAAALVDGRLSSDKNLSTIVSAEKSK